MDNDSHMIERFEHGAEPDPVTCTIKATVATHNARRGASADARAHLDRSRRAGLSNDHLAGAAERPCRGS